jgi:F-type H+-transporting ATPase subunit alpha
MLVVYIGSSTISGTVLDGLGNCIFSINPVDFKWCWLIDSPCTSIVSRAPVSEPIQTGVISIDTIVPVGRGQRELVLGDRQTGKSSLCLDSILNQKYEKLLCIYCALGLKSSSVLELFLCLVTIDCSFFVVFLLTSSSSAPAEQYYAPYCGSAIGEIFMIIGNQSCFLSLDDLSKHANCYREISLLLRRPPGREAYPGEVFFIHSRLLERSAKLSNFFGDGGSLSAWPIIETLAGDVGAYIATNVISITDGQIVLSQELFNSGIKPAIDVGLSVTRVGSSAQWSGMKLFAGTYKLELAQYAELKSFAQFSADLPASTRASLDRSSRVVELLKQPCGSPIPLSTQVGLLSCAPATILDPRRIDFSDLGSFVSIFRLLPSWLFLYVSPTVLGSTLCSFLAEANTRSTA